MCFLTALLVGSNWYYVIIWSTNWHSLILLVMKRVAHFKSLLFFFRLWSNCIFDWSIKQSKVFWHGTDAALGLVFSLQLLSIDIDLWLWSCGVQNMALSHHRTLSIYYWEASKQQGRYSGIRIFQLADRCRGLFVVTVTACRCRKFCPPWERTKRCKVL